VSYRVANDVHARPVHDEVMILDGRTNEYLGLNASGAVVWSVLAGGGSEAVAVAELMTRFEVDHDVAEADVTGLVNELLRRGIVLSTMP